MAGTGYRYRIWQAVALLAAAGLVAAGVHYYKDYRRGIAYFNEMLTARFNGPIVDLSRPGVTAGDLEFSREYRLGTEVMLEMPDNEAFRAMDWQEKDRLLEGLQMKIELSRPAERPVWAADQARARWRAYYWLDGWRLIPGQGGGWNKDPDIPAGTLPDGTYRVTVTVIEPASRLAGQPVRVVLRPHCSDYNIDDFIGGLGGMVVCLAGLFLLVIVYTIAAAIRAFMVRAAAAKAAAPHS
ncbi:MAG: hypothetical protein BIFFINMI_02847 [Phycisphaerae bacterium]|nr:hypothetical protein [Phycisphaerae bacterium]